MFFDALIRLSVRHKGLVLFAVLGLALWGGWSAVNLPLDAVPDITNNQVQVITQSPSLAPQEVEQLLTQPVELALMNLPGRVETRSLSRFGLSIVTIVFEEEIETLHTRQLVAEQLLEAAENIPKGLGTPRMMPITTGLGEIYQYTLKPQKGFEGQYSALELREIQDWVVKRHLAGIPGVAEVSSFGGFVKQYEVAVSPEKLSEYGLSLRQIYEVLQQNNQNAGGGYIEKTQRAYYIRAEGRLENLAQIEALPIVPGQQLRLGDVARVRLGHALRFGALTQDGKGEAVGGIVMMLKGENAYAVTERVQERVKKIQSTLPKGLKIEPYLDRSDLVNRTIRTVAINLAEGGLIVIFVLILMLGHLRAGFIVASVIPLALLFALGLMRLFGVSANLMSLGAIDFGLVVDGSVIIIEAVLHNLHTRFTQTPERGEFEEELTQSAQRIRKSAAFGEFVILIVYLPILALSGIEGKMFQPMAMTVCFAILGGLLLSLTYVPAMGALFLRKHIKADFTFPDKFIAFLYRYYDWSFQKLWKIKGVVLAVVLLIFAFSLWTFNRMGGEFIPTLEEGDLACQQVIPTGGSLQESVRASTEMQKILLAQFPEIKTIVAKIGSAEVPTDPMGIEDSDIMIVLKEKDEWTSANTREELVEKMKRALEKIPHAEYEFTQPIQLRFNELMTGVKSDIALKIFGEDLELLAQKGEEVATLIAEVPGAADVRVEQTEGFPQLIIRFRREALAQYGLHAAELAAFVRAAYAGQPVGLLLEGERRFEIVVRLSPEARQDLTQLADLRVPLPNGTQIPLQQVADIQLKEGPALINREEGKRRIVIGVNARGRDVQSIVQDIQQRLEVSLELPPGYLITYGGAFENLQDAQARLLVAVPVALALIFLLLYVTFGKIRLALLIFTAIPLSAIGGIFALELRGMPFSISAGVGFIALFGVAVLNGIVLVSQFEILKENKELDLLERLQKSTALRFRPVLTTALVAALGFLPMMLSTQAGAEVQQPLATVVVGGLLTATLLTLYLLPMLYALSEHSFSSKK